MSRAVFYSSACLQEKIHFFSEFARLPSFTIPNSWISESKHASLAWTPSRPWWIRSLDLLFFDRRTGCPLLSVCLYGQTKKTFGFVVSDTLRPGACSGVRETSPTPPFCIDRWDPQITHGEKWAKISMALCFFCVLPIYFSAEKQDKNEASVACRDRGHTRLKLSYLRATTGHVTGLTGNESTQMPGSHHHSGGTHFGTTVYTHNTLWKYLLVKWYTHTCKYIWEWQSHAMAVPLIQALVRGWHIVAFSLHYTTSSQTRFCCQHFAHESRSTACTWSRWVYVSRPRSFWWCGAAKTSAKKETQKHRTFLGRGNCTTCRLIRRKTWKQENNNLQCHCTNSSLHSKLSCMRFLWWRCDSNEYAIKVCGSRICVCMHVHVYAHMPTRTHFLHILYPHASTWSSLGEDQCDET